MTDSLRIYTDGSCSPNPGPGGWGVILLFPGSEKAVELKGGEEQSTNKQDGIDCGPGGDRCS